LNSCAKLQLPHDHSGRIADGAGNTTGIDLGMQCDRSLDHSRRVEMTNFFAGKSTTEETDGACLERRHSDRRHCMHVAHNEEIEASCIIFVKISDFAAARNALVICRLKSSVARLERKRGTAATATGKQKGISWHAFLT
jgi:hypothetical protein